jgi:beta-N-acetylhexosaminidase
VSIVDVGPDGGLDGVLSGAEGRPVVALVRELHRHPTVGAAVQALARRRPDVVVVETGWPGDASLPGAASLLTFGASRANVAAADGALAEGWRP